MPKVKHALVILEVVALCLGARHRAGATTFVLMDETELAERSVAVVMGRVTDVESQPSDATGGVNTYVSIEPSAVIAGALPEGEIVLREPGGRANGSTEKIYGGATYNLGEHVVVFLSAHPDGALHTTGMSMGKYTIRTATDGTLTATRTFGTGVGVLSRSTGRFSTHATPDVSDLPELIAHVESTTTAGVDRHAAPLRLTPPEVDTTPSQRYQTAFTYLDPSAPGRWFEPDSGAPVLYFVDPNGYPGIGVTASRSAVDSALAAWSNVSTANLQLRDAGALSTLVAFAGCDGGNRIVFNDPFNEITDPTNCGGILAVGGYCTTDQTTTVNGTLFDRIVVAKVTFNNGWDRCSLWNACDLAEVATHELGHTIGLGHSADTSATMYAAAHFDGRCASLGADDVTGVSFVYPRVGASQPTATATPIVTATTTRTPTHAAAIAQTPTLTATRVPIQASTFTQTVRPTATFTAAPAPAGSSSDACAAAISITTLPYVGSAVTTSATIEGSDPSPPCGNGSRGRSVWYRFTAPNTGTLSANTFGSSYDTILSAYTGTCGGFRSVAGGCNDDASYTTQSQVTFATTAGTTYYFMVSAYSNNGGALHFQLSFQGSGASSTPTVAMTPRPPTATFTPGPPTSTFTPAPPRTATFTLGPLAPTSAPPPPTATAASGGSSNDFCANAAVITGSSYATTVITSTATTEAADPGLTCGNGSRSKSVWYRFTAPSTGTLTANTFGSSYDTILSVYSGTCGAFRSVAPGCNDDAGGTMQSQLAMTTTAGATYYFMVTAYSGNGGTQRFQLTFQNASVAATPLPTSAAPAATATSIPPPTPTNATVAQSNDACPDAVTISAAPYAGTASTATATIATNDPFPTCGNGSRARSVWYRFTAPSTTRITADTFGSGYDTILSVYTGACGALTAVGGACNDDAGVPQSQVSFSATAGTTYYFLVTAYSNSGGALVFHLTAS